MKKYKNGNYTVTIAERNGDFFLEDIRYNVSGRDAALLEAEQEFVISGRGVCGKPDIKEGKEKTVISIAAQTEEVKAESVITLTGEGVFRTQAYTVLKDFEGFINPRFKLADAGALYTYPLRVYDAPAMDAGNIRSDYTWAVPLPAHIWHTDGYCAVYGIDRNFSVGTLDCAQSAKGTFLGCYYPDTSPQAFVSDVFQPRGGRPETKKFLRGSKIVISEFIKAAALAPGKNPLTEAEKLAAAVFLKKAVEKPDFVSVADNIALYYKNNGLWEKDVFEKGKGWYRCTWMRTQEGIPEKENFYDLGWGEGYGVLTLSALVRHSLRKKTSAFKNQIEHMTRNMDYFLRDKNVKGAYYERFIGAGAKTLLVKNNIKTPMAKDIQNEACDFLGQKIIWTHSLAQTGYQLALLYREAADYPDKALRAKWYETAKDIGDFLLSRQRGDGDINDGFFDDDGEANRKPHRIPARALVCGLWARLYLETKEEKYLAAARKLAAVAGKEIGRYEFYNQMIDGHQAPHLEIDPNEVYDAENACYAFQGLVELYDITRDGFILELCLKCAAYFISWMFFYDIPNGVNGVTRGATTCRMVDWPLVYTGAGAFAYRPLLRFAELTKDGFYDKIADEIITCIAKYQYRAEGKPWDYGIVHAVDQSDGRHWGPDKQGQMDTGMTSGNALADIEYLIKR